MIPAGRRFRDALLANQPLQVVGTPNALCAMMAVKQGHRALYLSGACVANAVFGLPDLGLTGFTDTLCEARRITAVTDTPLLVDCDTGWGSNLSLARAVRELESAGIAAIHVEDQAHTKRCGHRPNKVLVSIEAMAGRIEAAVAARRSEDFFIMARTDSFAGEGLASVIVRCKAYIEAGADAVFADALASQGDFQTLVNALDAPVLANMTEFGCTELLSLQQLRELGVSMALYPLTAFRMMNCAADIAYQALNVEGDQRKLVPHMQTREQLYELLDYYQREFEMDRHHQGDQGREGGVL